MDNSKLKRLQGQGTGRTPYGGVAKEKSSGSFDYAPITLVRSQFAVALRSG
jgi:hypothetical protein